MKSPASEHVTLVEILELTRPFDEFESVSRAVARRLELEGIAALVTFQVYAEPGSNEVGLIITFADRSLIMQHITMIAGWEEFGHFLRTAKPIDVRVYGTLSAEAEEWLRKVNVVSRTFTGHVAGFVR